MHACARRLPTIRMRASRWARTTGRGPSGRSASQARHARISVSSTSSGARVSFGIESDRGRSGHAASPGGRVPGAGRRRTGVARERAPPASRGAHHACDRPGAPLSATAASYNAVCAIARAIPASSCAPSSMPQRRYWDRNHSPSRGSGGSRRRRRGSGSAAAARRTGRSRSRRAGAARSAGPARRAHRATRASRPPRDGARRCRATRTHRRACGSARGPWPDTARRNRAGPRAPSPDDRARSRS